MPRAHLPDMPLRTRVFASILARIPAMAVDKLTVADLPKARDWVPPSRGPFARIGGPVSPRVGISETSYPTRDGATRMVRVYRPSTPGQHALVVYLHGGGWVLGNPRQYDPLCSLIADAVDAVVLSFDYRLGPESPAPTAALDAVDAVRWAAEWGPHFGADPQRLGVAGDSAGGGLSTSACLIIRDEGGPTVRHQALMYPGVDLTLSQPSISENADGPVLTAQMMRVFTGYYLDGSGMSPDDPLVSPLHHPDLSGLPPALVQTAQYDPVRDEGLAYAARLAQAGVPVRSTTYAGVPHGFMNFPGVTLCGQQARYELVQEMRRHLQ